MKSITSLLIALITLSYPVLAQAPEPYGPLPSERQLTWHRETDFYAFVHFNMNTFTDMEWGYGNESPEMFNPTELDCRQWAKVCKEAGMKGIIITAKHHDGFCLWPSEYTEHSVKNSPWKDGQGDVIRELKEACDEYGLKLGIYLSPWDRNHPDYGKPAYLTYFRNQLKELLTNYGDVFEVWFDGANGGTGYYGGADENREVDRKTYYDWDTTFDMIREMQPNAVIFSDGGPDVRWVGTEEGFANKTNWSLLRRDEVWPGWPNYVELRSGHEDGTHWVPAEVNTSIRPGWYYHASEDHKVKTLPQLLDTYYHSIGRNGSFLLNFPVDKRGLIHEEDVKRMQEFAAQIKKDFANDLAANKTLTASNARGKDFGADKLNDGNPETYWATEDGVKEASVMIDLEEPTWVNRLLVQEYIPLGQRVKAFKVEAYKDDQWEELANETTIGYKRILRFPDVQASKIRLTVMDAKACPVISNLSLYRAPKVLVEPAITRNQQDTVTITSGDDVSEIFYTLDGSTPDANAKKYSGPFVLSDKATVKAVVVDTQLGEQSPVATAALDISKKDWQILQPQGESSPYQALFDGNPATFWGAEEETLPAEWVLDLAEQHKVSGFSYLPDQSRYAKGIASEYEVFISNDQNDWGKPVQKGEFSNIRNNPIEQQITFSPVEGRYVKIVFLKVLDDQKVVQAAELGIMTE